MVFFVATYLDRVSGTPSIAAAVRRGARGARGRGSSPLPLISLKAHIVVFILVNDDEVRVGSKGYTSPSTAVVIKLTKRVITGNKRNGGTP